MRTLARTFLLGICCLSSPASAEESAACESKLFDQYNLLSQNTLSIPKHAPRDDLLAFVHRYEMLCPWQFESDFNADNQKDWVGIIYKQGRYELVAYYSHKGRYKAQSLRTYTTFPKSTFLRVVTTPEAVNYGSDKTKLKAANQGIVEHEINGNSQIYFWNGKSIDNIYEFKNKLSINQQVEERKSNSDDNDTK